MYDEMIEGLVVVDEVLRWLRFGREVEWGLLLCGCVVCI